MEYFYASTGCLTVGAQGCPPPPRSVASVRASPLPPASLVA
eukprot:SAG31_NODE_14406_length_808_cov_1.139633_1_plen_40_part_01